MRVSSEALWEWNLASNRIHFSPRWMSLVGCEEHEVGNTPDEWLNRIHPEELRDVLRQVDVVRADEGDAFELRHRLRHKDGGYRWTTCRVAVERDQAGGAVRLMGVHEDVTAETVTDKLTGLPNRLLLLDRLAHSIERAHQYEGFHYACLLVDLGGQSSAAVLTAAARRLETSLRIANANATLRSNDIVARIDGDQFAILLDGLKAVSHAKVAADRILTEILTPLTINGREMFLAASIGIAVSATGYTEPDEVLRDAETALHRARVLGGSHCEVFDTAVVESHQSELQLEGDLKEALERREFRLLYQPIVSMMSDEILGFEALVRWQHPALGVISPVDFIPLAEKTGLIVPLGEWILREACSRLKTWQDDLPRSADVWMSVNLSAVQLKDPALMQRVGAALRDSGLQPRSLMLELTESTAMENPTGIKSLLMQLRSTGVRISVDDFGTGYSSLAHLRQFPIDTLKIDRSFVRGIETRQDSAAIVGTLTDMAQQLGLEVVAEGIENEHQLTLLRSLRCHAAQGFLFARPLDDDKATEMLRRGLARPTMPTAAPRRPLALSPSATWPWAACVAIVLLTVGFLFSPLGSVAPTALPAVTPPPPPPAVTTEVTNTNPVPWTPVVPAESGRGIDENVATNATARAATRDGRTASPPTPTAAVPALPKPSTSAITIAPPAPPEPLPVRVQNTPPAADALSVRVTHDHRVGHCEGQLIVSRAGISYVPDDATSKDAFDFKYNDFVHLFQDDTLTIKSSTRTYRFRAEDKGRGPTLADFESRLARVR